LICKAAVGTIPPDSIMPGNACLFSTARSTSPKHCDTAHKGTFMTRTMNRFQTLLLVLSLSASPRAFAADPAPVMPGDLLAVTGDSITEQRKYSVFIEDYLLMCKPVENVRTMQFGWGGDTTWGFNSDKIENDVLRFHPTVATTCFGMNDGGYRALTPQAAERYRNSTQSIIDKFKAGGVRTIILGSPGSVGAELKSNAAEYNKTLAALRDIDKELAAKNHVIFADVYTPLIETNAKARAKYGPKYQLNGPDGIHPHDNGHLVMAYAFLKALGFTGDIGTITFDMSSGTTTVTDGHKAGATLAETGSIATEFESTRYPFCFTGDPGSPDATAGVIEFFPFNQDLNRFMLVVKNAPAEKLKVTWGNATKEFSAADLAKGVNLAAEFLDNPFSEKFAKVHAAVQKQQGFETPFIKKFVYNIPDSKTYVADNDKGTFDSLAESGAARDKQLFESAASMVTPVHYSIKIESVK